MKLGFKQDIELRHFTFVSVAERRSHINLTRRLESKREPAPAPASKPESETKSGFEGESQYHSKLENIPEVESKSESALVSYQEPEPRESLPGSQPADLLDSQANDQTHEATLPTETLEPVPAPQEVVYSNPLQAEPQSLPPEVTISLQRAPEPAPIGPQQPSPAQIEESTTASSEGCSVSSTESPESSEVPQLRTTVAQEDCSGLERSTIPEASQPSLPPATVDEEASLTHAPPPVVEEPELPAAKVEESNVSATEQAESPEIPPAATDRSGSHDPANSGEPNNTHLDSCPGQNVSQEDRVTEPETEATGASDGDSGASISGEDDNPIPENTVEATDERDEDDKPTPEHSVATSYERDDDEFSQSLTRSSSLASSRSSSSASSQGHSQAEIVKVTEGH